MRTSSPGKFALALFMAGALAAGPVLADKPEGAGGGKPSKSAKERHKGEKRGGDDDDRRDRHRHDHRGEGRVVYFDDHHRAATREYFEGGFRSGHCPPGLAKKANGCLPPGQAKKWHIGRPLPREVTFYDLPPQVVVQLGTPPAGHRFVRVAGDILLIAIGTGMVIDAIEDLGRQ